MPAVHDRKQLSSISPSVDAAVETYADSQSPISGTAERRRAKAAWQLVIDQTLLRWLENPSLLNDVGVEPPSGAILRLAIDYAEKFRNDCLLPPEKIVPDANGGIVFKRREGEITEAYHFWTDGTIEYQQYIGAHLSERITA